ncbi:MAG: prolyl oligopeptidase family serine peptidase [Phycisphaerae bacterium]|nr:prolyl oligopeptidase family serine peptidase [Phycisphaerae bacterium]
MRHKEYRLSALGCTSLGGARLLAGAALLTLLVGCVVPQPRGAGQLQRFVEPTTRRPYYLYLPRDYMAADDTARAARRWPLVVTFHGMKPYDIALYQAQEWQQEADRYGFVVVAPVLTAFDFFTGEFPLRTLNRAFKSDELATLAIVNHVLETTAADPENVLSTSWSSGGYLAHYMLNRHPERFTCLAVRQSNFAAEVLDAVSTSQSLYHPILIVGTENDVPICQEESREAIRWYESHGYRNFAWVHLNRLGHERTPDTAADFFARVAGVTPNKPPHVLVGRQAIDGNPAGLALLAGNLGQMQQAPGMAARAPVEGGVPSRPVTQPRPVMVAVTAPRGGPASAPPAEPPPAEPVTSSVQAEPTPARRAAARAAPVPSPIGIRLSSAIGFQPLLLVYSAESPSDWQRTAKFYWTLDGEDIGAGVNGQRMIAHAGDYQLGLRVVTAAGAEHHATRQIRVLKSLETSAVPTSVAP